MGTREVYEEKLRRGDLPRDPTLNPGLGAARCPRCLSLLKKSEGSSEWEITSVLHSASAVAGIGLGGLLSGVFGVNTGIPCLQNYFKGPKWLPFVVGLPPLITLSAAFGGFAFPKFTQLTVTSYYAASSTAHYGVSLLTRQIEESHVSKVQHKKSS